MFERTISSAQSRRETVPQIAHKLRDLIEEAKRFSLEMRARRTINRTAA